MKKYFRRTELSIESLHGSQFNDILLGNTGNNMIKGGLGNDTLTGNAGQDGFVFDTALNASSNKDVIADFNVTDDTIYLENSIFAKLTTVGGLSITNFCSNATGIASDADDFIVYNSTTGLLSYDADGNGAGASVVFAIMGVSTHPTLTAADFIVT